MSDYDNDWRKRRDQFDPDEDYQTFGDEDEEPNRRRPIILASIAVLILVFGGVVFLAYKQGINQGAPGEPPILRADNTPDKVAPENPGGTTVPHQDKTIYDRISGEDAVEENVEHLLPRAEEPMAVKKEEVAAAVETAPLAPPPVSEATPATVAPSAPGEPANITPQGGAITTAPVEEIPPAATPVEAAAPATAPVVTGTGNFLVQLAALRDEASALAMFKKLQAKFPNELGALASDIERADLGEKGIYFRLRAGPMDKPGAQAICSTLSAQGQGCLVKAR